MFTFKTTKILIKQEGRSKFVLQWFMEETVGFKEVDGKTIPVKSWKKSGDPIVFGKWEDVQVFLDENVDLNTVHIQNYTTQVVNMLEIRNSGRRYYW